MKNILKIQQSDSLCHFKKSTGFFSSGCALFHENMRGGVVTPSPTGSPRLATTGRVTLAQCGGFEEGVAEGAVGFGGTIQIGDALVPSALVDEPERKSLVADALDHGNEGVFGKALDKVRTATIDVNHSGADADIAEGGFGEQRIQATANEGIAA